MKAMLTQAGDMCYGNEGEDDKWEAVERVEWLVTDPLYGEEGPAMWEDDTLRNYAET